MTQTLTFYCQTLTPMLLHGADGQTPELRPPSIKGALRFWWRALHGHLSLDILKKREAMIFGSTDQKLGKSSFSIQIISPSPLPAQDMSLTYPLPHWVGNPNRNPFQVACIDTGVEFCLKIRMRQTVKLNSYSFNIDDLCKLFTLFAGLGSLGKRSRRGFGSFKITQAQKNNQDVTLPNQNDWLSSIAQLYQQLTGRSFVKRVHKLSNQPLPNAPFPFIKQVVIGQQFHRDLLKEIGDATSQIKQTNQDSSEYRQAMGHTKGRDRLGSPMYVSVIENSQGLFPIITTLNNLWGSYGTQQIQQSFLDLLL